MGDAAGEILRAVLFHRHGRRAPRVLLRDPGFWARRMPKVIDLERLEASFPTRPLCDRLAATSPLGRLTAAGLREMEIKGEALRRRYASLLSNVTAYSTSPADVRTARTVESARAFLRGLGKSSATVDVSLPFEVLVPDAPSRCEAQRAIECEIKQGAAFRAWRQGLREQQHRFTQQLLATVVAPESLSTEARRYDDGALRWTLIHDLLHCYEAEDALPEGFSSSDAALSAMAATAELQQYLLAPGYAEKAGLPLLRRALRDLVEGPLLDCALHVYSVHDSTLLMLLAAAGLEAPEWPPFAATLALELWREDGGFILRYVYEGEEIAQNGASTLLDLAAALRLSRL